MTIKLLVVGKTDVSLLEKIIEDYKKRIRFYIKFEIETIPDLKNTKNISQEEQKNKARPAYRGSVDVSPYDTIFIGYPIWWGDLPPVVYTFIEEHDMDGKMIIPFCTHEGSGMSGTAGVFRRMFKRSKITNGISVLGHTAQHDRHKADIAVTTWLKLTLRFIP